MNKVSIEETLHKVATGDWSVDRGCVEIESMHRESKIGQQSTIFDPVTHHDKNIGNRKKGIDASITSLGGDMKFNGSDYIEAIDKPRLQKQYVVIRDLMQDGKWRTLGEIENETNYPQASISAQLRNLRKKALGGHTIDKRRRGVATQGLFEYRLRIFKENQSVNTPRGAGTFVEYDEYDFDLCQVDIGFVWIAFDLNKIQPRS